MSGAVPRWNAIKYRSSVSDGQRRRLPQKSAAGRAARTKIKTEEIQNVTWAPHCAGATKTVAAVSRRNRRTGHGRENKRRTHTRARANGNDGRRETTTLDDGRTTIAPNKNSRHARDTLGRSTAVVEGNRWRRRRTVIAVAVPSVRALCPRRPRARETFGYHVLSAR